MPSNANQRDFGDNNDGVPVPYQKYQGNDPKRRIARPEIISREVESNLAKARYVGSAHHKTRAADYSFNPPVNPRPHKCVCDDIRTVHLREAIEMFRSGVQLGMISSSLVDARLPKYVWAVDSRGEPYEAKLGDDGTSYHGYRLCREQRMRRYIIAAWREKCS